MDLRSRDRDFIKAVLISEQIAPLRRFCPIVAMRVVAIT